MKEAKIHSAISNSLSIAIFMSTEWTVIKTGLFVLLCENLRVAYKRPTKTQSDQYLCCLLLDLYT